jgi:hypothetical protein
MKNIFLNYNILYFILFCIITYFIYNNYYNLLTHQDISNLTDKWIYEVTIINSPENIQTLFCKDGSLVGTVSKIIRTGEDIKFYFNYFSKLPGIKVVNKKYNIMKITNNVFLNTAFITWTWNGLKEPITARMTFIYRDKCIFQLHSSVLPEINKNLVNISGLG